MRTVRPLAAMAVGLAMVASACSPATSSTEEADAAAGAAALEVAASEASASEAARIAEQEASEAARVAAEEEAARVAAEEEAARIAAEEEAARIAAEEEAARVAAEEEAARIAAEEEAARIAAEEEAARIAAEEEAARIAAEKKKEAQGFQTTLKELGYYTGQVDGDVGKMTVAAIKAFQEVNGLTVDGEVGAKTTAALASDDALPKPPPEPEPKPEKEGSSSVDVPSDGVLSVADAQRVLIAMNYYGGSADGNATDSFRTALVAFQKVEGIAADGSLGPNTSDRLRSPRTPSLQGGEGNRIEIDLSRQVIHVVKGGQRIRTMPTSSGNGETYEQKSGGTATALTPVGDFRIQRRIEGVREADLGILYDPLYFYSGWAIHGSNSVPSYPASHGCTRVSRTDIIWLAGQMPNGTQVRVYGGTHVFTP